MNRIKLKYTLPLSFLFSSILYGDTLEKTSDSYLANSVWGMVGSYDTKYDSLHFTTIKDLKIYFDGDVLFSKPYFSVWKDVTYGSDASPKRNIDHYGTNYAVNLDNGWKRTLTTESVTLFNADMRSEVMLEFLGNHNQLTLNNSGIYPYRSGIEWGEASPARIHAASGDNYLKGLEPTKRTPKSMRIDVDAGASLVFEYAGDIASSETFEIRAPTDANVDNGTLKFEYSHVYIRSTPNFLVHNNSTLKFSGSGTKVKFENLDVDSSQISLGKNTRVDVDKTWNLKETTLDFDDNAKLFSNGVIKTEGTITLNGSDVDTGIRGANSLDMRTETEYIQNDIGNSTFGYVSLESGSSINLNNTTLTVEEKLFSDNIAGIKVLNSTHKCITQ